MAQHSSDSSSLESRPRSLSRKKLEENWRGTWYLVTCQDSTCSCIYNYVVVHVVVQTSLVFRYNCTTCTRLSKVAETVSESTVALSI